MTIYLFYKSLVAPGGAERLIIEEYKAFKALGYNVKLVVFNYKTIAFFGEDLEHDLIKLNSKFWFISLIKLILLLKRFDSSLVISSSGMMEVYLASLVARTEFSLHVHHPTTMKRDTSKYSYFLRDKYSYILARSYEKEVLEEQKNKFSIASFVFISLRQLCMQFAIRNATHIFVLSRYGRDELKHIYNVESHVLQGAIKKVDPDCNTIPLIANSHGLKVLSVSRLEPQKRIDQAIYAFSDILKTFPSATMFIGGSGPQEIQLKEIVARLNITDRVIFLGFIPNEQLFDYYSSADIFLSLDWADFNITVIEAVSAGTKAVVSDEGEFDVRLVDNGYICTVDPKSRSEISNGIYNLHAGVTGLDKDNFRAVLDSYTWVEYCKRIARIHGF